MTTDHDTSGQETSDLASIIDTHLAGYAETDPTRRRELLCAAWAADGSLIDPPLQGNGIDAIIGCGEAVVTHYPGYRFVRTSGIDVHNGVARYGWELRDPSGDAVLDGIDIAETNDAGQLVRIVGFFGLLPAHE